MYTPSHRGSIRVTAALRRFKQEHAKMLPFANQRTDLLDSITVCKPAGVESEDWTPPDAEDVIRGKVVGFRVRVGNKFGSVEKIGKQVAYLDGEIAECRGVMYDCRQNLRRLLGGTADKLCAQAERENLGS